MPLVSGVCRTASAPMLSHGGSRLNASKPEANPKTRFPTPTTTSQHPSSAVVRHSKVVSRWIPCLLIKPWHLELKNLFLSLREFSAKGSRSNRLSNHCCLRSLGGAKYFHDHKNLLKLQFTHLFRQQYDWTIHFKRRRQTTNSLLQRPSPNERTCIGWHKRYASVSGRGSRGIYVPRR